MKVYPPVGVCVVFVLKRFALIAGVILLAGVVIRFFEGEPLIEFLSILQLALLLAGLALVAGGAVYLILRALAWSIEPFGLVGRSYWGRRTRIAWTDVSRVALLPGDIPGLVVMSASSKNEIVAYLLGVDSTEVYAHVSRYAGHTHVFAQWFKQRSA